MAFRLLSKSVEKRSGQRWASSHATRLMNVVLTLPILHTSFQFLRQFINETLCVIFDLKAAI